ncbi:MULTISPECIES: NAD(P)H-binding protein [Leuconostoc]|uniref:NAD(P)H-binding protein n=1 Tax=Leuconostoc TaxID=1243 RepID=UPI001B8BEA1A|nr:MULTISPECIES: NAD(P)H-binding protein [Leuconostoc]MBS0941889.1 NAD(P)H-binding protein [Leuconostoc mesenteroides]MBS1008146.1 NAD(P)H-binding protein [Leuconostoc suionicum]
MNILILGAAGQISQQLTTRLLNETDTNLTLFARNAEKRLSMYKNNNHVRLISGEFEDESLLAESMQGQDVVYANSDRNMQPILAAMKKAGVKRIIIAGALSIYDEVGGAFGKWNRSMMGPTPDSRKKMISDVENSGLDYTYMRMTWLYNQKDNVAYATTQKGEPFVGAQVTREAIVQYILDLLANPNRDLQASVGIYEPGTEDMAKPSFY